MLLLLTFAAAASALRSAPLGLREKQLQQKLQAVVDKHAAFWNVSISFAIHNDTVELAVAGGADDYAHPGSSRLTPDHRIPAGSTTKMYTAIAVMRLVENGTIALDEPVAPLVDEYLARPMPCEEAPDYCQATCAPRASCYATKACSDLTPAFNAKCSYCLRHLHCYPAADRPTAATFRGIWEGDARVESITFRHLLSMASGLKDYYYDTTNWLYYSVMNSTRDVEPLEALLHQEKGFVFSPGETLLVPEGKPGAGQNVTRGAYSTNAFSVVGLALAGRLGLADWAALDQRALAWGDRLPADDRTLFPTRGTCLAYEGMAHQYTSEHENATFVEISNHSCLNSWLGGNIAPRPLDVARFVHAAYRNDSNALISARSLGEVLALHPLTDGFAAYQLAYGLGLEGYWYLGQPTSVQLCSAGSAYGHGGLDYGSGAPANFYVPSLRLGVSLAMASAISFGSAVAGMNCSRPWASLGGADAAVQNELLNALAEYAGLAPECPVLNFTVPPASECDDAPSFGTVNSQPTTCAQFVETIQRSQPVPTPVAQLCTTWLGRRTLRQIEDDLAASGVRYRPPGGVDPDRTTGEDLCKATCGRAGAGPCWLRAPTDPWCGADARQSDAAGGGVPPGAASGPRAMASRRVPFALASAVRL